MQFSMCAERTFAKVDITLSNLKYFKLRNGCFAFSFAMMQWSSLNYRDAGKNILSWHREYFNYFFALSFAFMQKKQKIKDNLPKALGTRAFVRANTTEPLC